MPHPSAIRKVAFFGDYLPSCRRTADFLNRNDSSKYSDRSAFKSAMTGVAGFSCSHFERLSASPRGIERSESGLGLALIIPRGEPARQQS